MKDVIYDDVSNGLLFLETGVIVHRKEYIANRDAIFFGSYTKELDGGGIIAGYKTKEKLGFFKDGIPYYSKLGLLKLGNMDVHIMGKATFEDTIIKYLSNIPDGRCKQLYINLDGTLDDMRLFFLKYINNVVLTKIMWYLTRGKSVSIRLEIKYNKIIYSIAHYLDGVDLGKHSSKFYNVNDFLKAYETMGLELAPAIEEDKQYDYPKTTTIGNLSIHDDKIIEAYNQFLTMVFNVEKYEGISLRIPKGYNDDWFTLLIRKLVYLRGVDYRLLRSIEFYINIKLNNSNKHYVYNTNTIDNQSDDSKVLSMSITDLQTRLIDIIQDTKSSIFDSGDKVNINDRLISEVKDDDSKVSETDSKSIEETIGYRNIDNAFKLLSNILTSSDYVRHGKIPVGAIEYIKSIANGDKGISDPKLDNTGYTIRKVRPTQSTFKRLSESNKLDKLTVNDIVTDSELNLLKNTYDIHVDTAYIRYRKDEDVLDAKYKSIFKNHIAKGVLYPKLRFNYDYDYIVNENGVIEYGVVKAHVVPFNSMVSNKPINIHKDIMERYSVLISTQTNMSSNPVGSNVIDSNQVDSCIDIYRTMFSRYIELGILKNTLIFDVVKNNHTFPAIWEIYNEQYIYQYKPTRLYNIYLNVVLAFSDNMNLRYAKTTIISIYKSMFKRYIEMGLLKSDLDYNTCLTFPTIDDLWLVR